MTTYRIETTKGAHEGSLDECVAWQAEYQGAAGTLVCPDGVTVDVSECDDTVEAWQAAIEAERV